ncbi:MAG: hypothetical protein WD733_17615 [Bryobacterales bacterium]
MSSRPPSPPPVRVRSFLADGLALYALTALLIWPLFGLVYHNWGSIESTFIAHARYLVEYWPHPQWQPLWYCGTRFDYIYPPALSYGTAIFSMLFSLPLPQAYHVYVGLFYCLGTASLYVLVRAVSGSRAMAWGVAITNVLVSPSFHALELIRIDALAVYSAPQRLSALERWGEGPHISALCVIPLALGFAYWAMTRRNLAALSTSAVLCALVVSNNFYGAVALAIFYPLLVWSVWVTHQEHQAWLWAAAIPVLAYGLTAVWLTPSYLRETTANLATVGASGESFHVAIFFAITAVFLVVSYIFGRFRRDLTYPIFISGATLVFVLAVLGDAWLGLRVFGSAMRFVPELDIVLILAWFEICRQLAARVSLRMPSQTRLLHAAAAALAFAPLLFSHHYVRNAWRLYVEDVHFEQRVEYRLSQWMAQNRPDVRTYVEGSIRFWYNVWHDLPQLTGGSHQGTLNQTLNAVEWNLRSAEAGEWAKEWMLAFGVGATIVSDKTSQDVYPTLVDPRKFDGVLPVLHDNGAGDVIYEVPRRFAARARVVERAVVEQLLPVSEGWYRDRLQAYVQAIEQGPDSPVTQQWRGPETMLLSAAFESGQLLLVQESYDPAWHAYLGETELQIREDVLGQMLVDAPPGEQEIRMQFELPLENLIGRVLTALSVLCVLALWVAGVRRRLPS